MTSLPDEVAADDGTDPSPDVMAEARRQHRHRQLGLWTAAAAVPWVGAAALIDHLVGGRAKTDYGGQLENGIMLALTVVWALAVLWWSAEVVAARRRPRELRAEAKAWRASAAAAGLPPWPGRTPDRCRTGVWTWVGLAGAATFAVSTFYWTVQAGAIAAGLAGTPMHASVYVQSESRFTTTYAGTVSAPPEYAGREIITYAKSSDGTYYAWPAGDRTVWPRRLSQPLLRFASLAAAFGAITAGLGNAIVSRRRLRRAWHDGVSPAVPTAVRE